MNLDIQAAFTPARDTLSWAKTATDELDAELAKFVQTNPAALFIEFRRDTGQHVLKAKQVKPITSQPRRKATEALTNLRHAFDQAVFAAQSCLGARTKNVNFPWAITPIDLDHMLVSRGIHEAIRDVFRLHEPYGTADTHPGGNDSVRTMAKLANQKHTVGLLAEVWVKGYGDLKISGENMESFEALQPNWDPVKKEAELARWVGNLKVENNYQLYIEIFFEPPEGAQPVKAVTGLDAFAQYAERVIESLERRCMELRG